MIALHFAAFAFVPETGIWGDLAFFVGVSALAAGGVLFIWAAIPYRSEISSRWMVSVLLATYTLYLGLLIINPIASWALTPAAVLIGVLPIVVVLVSLRHFRHPLRWVIVFLNTGLSIFLVSFQNRPGNGPSLALNAVFFTVYFGCGIHFWYAYRRATAGALITVSGFFAWAWVFVAGPCMHAVIPQSPDRKRSLESSQIHRGRGHDHAAPGGPARAQQILGSA